MDGRYASKEFFHFVGHSSPSDDEKNYQTLVKVLENSCVSHPPHPKNATEATWGKVSHETVWDHRLETEKLIVPTVTCFADIPFECLSIHTKKYGKFGISLPRWLLIKYGARPVMYIPMRSDDYLSIHGLTLLRDIEATVKGFKEHAVDKLDESVCETRSLGAKPASQEEAVSRTHQMVLKDFLAFLKPFNSELHIRDPENYYMEREWRKYGNMKFETEQISRVVVAKGFKQKIEDEFPVYSGRISEV